jgi:hypothetical protein
MKGDEEDMKRLDLLDRENVRLINEFENEILELIDNQEKFTRSDLQGAVGALVIKILNKGISLAQEK